MGIAKQLNRHTLHLAKSLYDKPAFVPQFKEGGEVKGALPPGLIKGAGTGKSDSIKANLPAQGFVLPIEVVQAIGADKLQAIIDLLEPESAQEDMMEMGEEVPAKVSNGEVLIPPEIVKMTGPEMWEGLVKNYTGETPQPEMDEGMMKAAGGGLAEQRGMAQQFWKTAPTTPAPIAGRANPANPADMMRARLANSAQAMKPMGALPQPAPTPTPAPTPSPGALPVNSNAGVPESIAPGMLTSMAASQVLNSPRIAGQIDSGISSLKESAGFSPNATPFKYAKGGLVDDEENTYYNSLKNKVNEYSGLPLVPAAGKFMSDAGGTLAQGAREFGQDYTQGAREFFTPNETYKKALYGNEPTAFQSLFQNNAQPKVQQPSIRPNTGALPQPPVVTQPPVQPRFQQQEQPRFQQPVTQGAINRSPSYNETGLRNDNSLQVLDWNESRFDNSGDPVQDAALANRRGALAGLRGQADVLSQYDPEVARSVNPASVNIPQGMAQEQELARMNQQGELERAKILAGSRPTAQYKPAFTDADLDDMPEGATDSDILGISTMPAPAWQGFKEHLNIAKPGERAGIIQQMAERSGISPAVLMYKLKLGLNNG